MMVSDEYTKDKYSSFIQFADTSLFALATSNKFKIDSWKAVLNKLRSSKSFIW
jgi:hypothetical protein